VEPPGELARAVGFMVGNVHVPWSSMLSALAPLPSDDLSGHQDLPMVESQVPFPKGKPKPSRQPSTGSL
jgi:hypothetical protein